MLSACGGETKKSETKQEEINATQESASKKESEKRVGDIIMVNGEMGVVFTVTADGQHGKVMSVSQIEKCIWNDAKAWCANLGQGWKLPTKDELLVIYSRKSVINSALSANNYQLIDANACYWSSDKEVDNYMWIVSMENGETDGEGKYNHDSVRAVSAF